MRLIDLFKMARGNLMRRKLRTMLTVLSIVIGTTSIILMIALGEGVQKSVMNEFDSLGSINVLYIYPNWNEEKTSRFYGENVDTGLTENDVWELSGIDGVEYAVPMFISTVTIYSSKHYNTVSIVGVDPNLMEELGFQLKEGRFPRDNVMEAVFGDKALEEFRKLESDNPNRIVQGADREEETEENEDSITISFGPTDKEYPFEPLEERYKFQFGNPDQKQEEDNTTKLYSLTGVGVLKEGDMNRDYNVYVPISILMKLEKSYYETLGIDYEPSYNEIMIKVKDMDRVQEITALIEKRGYSVFSLVSMLDLVNKTIGTMQMALGAIGGVALLVAAIGITNTMVMAVTERKKEIGVMKVIGATLLDIKRLFLLEASMIGLLGGGVGISICVGISTFINSAYFREEIIKQPDFTLSLEISNSLIVGGLIFTTLIGLLSGYLPALKAMKSSALEAIRND
jgi:ABC-type antimicrobial peptide transport system permease subunit